MTIDEYKKQVLIRVAIIDNARNPRAIKGSPNLYMATSGLGQLGYRELGLRNIPAAYARAGLHLLTEIGFTAVSDAIVYADEDTIAVPDSVGNQVYLMEEDNQTGILYLEPYIFYPHEDCGSC